MFLNRLEVVGFKSFAERINIDFNAGVTAVVGPNGSGKSNIIDAIRWVLGEQSARSLRGQRMEDIIFQGSDSRHSLNFAEVSLILNNKEQQLPIDYNEVSITRRVYRSGESEFLINKQPCRLKDIVDLFTDTGLGRESFSIIGQGRIDDILSSKAEERRAIFEEAAGVLKYKQRKIKAEFKLEETKDNLLRVEDIIHEIEQQLEPLKKQAEKATVYKERRQVLQDIEIALLVTEIEQLNNKWQHLLEEIKEDQLLEIEQKTKIQDEEALIIKKRHNLQQLDETINELHQQLLQTTEKIEQLEGRRNVIIERQKHATENKANLTKNIEVVSQKINGLDEQITEEERHKNSLLTDVNETSIAIKHVKNELEHGAEQIHEKIENLKSDYIEYLNEQAVLQNEEQSLKQQRQQTEHLKQGEDTYYQNFLEQQEKLKEKQTTLASDVSKYTKQVTETEQRYEEWKQTVASERTTFEQMQKKLYEGNETIAKMTSRKETLEEMKESFQGYFYSVKEILQAHQDGKLRDIYGAVINLIDVPSQYMTAIDTILGAQAQHIVVPDDTVARNTIEWLKNENKGRATFLPLASLSERSIPNQMRKQLEEHEGFVGIAADLVTSETTFKKVVYHLMGNAIVTKTLNDAIALARMTNRRFRIVTLHGDVIFPGGSMSGGARRQNNQSLFTREKELIELKEKLASFIKRANDYTKKVERQKNDVIALTEKQPHLEEQIATATHSLQTVQSAQNEVSLKLAALDDDLTTYNMSMKQYEDSLTEITEKTEVLTKKRERLVEKIKVTEAEIDTLTADEEALQHTRRNKENELHELQIKAAELEERRRHVGNRLDQLKEQRLQQQTDYDDMVNQLDELLQVDKHAEVHDKLAKEIEDSKEARDQFNQDLEARRTERSQVTQAIEDKERELKEQERLHDKMVNEIQQKEVKATRLDVALENHLTHLQSEYVMTYERASERYEKVDDIEEARQQVKEVKASIAALGTVNLGAIEEYERLTERYSFLMEQKEDLLEAKSTLYAVIDEMDEEMIKRFSVMFQDIQVAFTDVFKKLFGGGHAELVLTDKDNLLETGIEIIASPPGKKQKALSLLSGGERALTAIALLFAILRVKPVPFCILDEVDASLDEANVVRFSNYLNTYSDGTQFIVITHRKGTMEEADVLYGVTMQESGVSRLVSVRLEDAGELMETS